MGLDRRTFGGGLIGAAALAAARPGRSWAADRDRVVVAQASDVLTLDASVDTSSIGVNFFKHIYDQLTDITPDGGVAPLLATGWETTPDAKSWTFTLRRDAKFHDGKPITADDVVWSFTKIMADARSPVRIYLNRVAKVEKVGDDKVRFDLTQPYAPFPRQVSLISILPQKAYEEMGAAKFGQNPVGSGPYRVVRWAKDEAIEMAAFAEYWAGKPPIGTILFRPVPAESARAAALISGECDLVPLLPPALLDRLGSRPGIDIRRVESNRVIYLGYNVNEPLFSDIRVRRAFDQAINRPAMCDRLLRGMGKPVGQVIAPVTFGYDPTIAPTPFDPEGARRLLREAGYKGETVPFTYIKNRTTLGEEVAQAIGGYLTDVGVKLELRGMEYTTAFPIWTSGKMPGLHQWSFGPSIMDGDLTIGYVYGAGGAGSWIDAEVQDLIARERAEPDTARRKALLAQILKKSADNVIYSPLYVEVQAYGIRNGLSWTPRPDERVLMQFAKWS